MKDILLKIMFKNFVQEKEHQESCASELAELFEKFDEWKLRNCLPECTVNFKTRSDDWHWTIIEGGVTYDNDNLFTYWYTEVHTK